MSLCQRGNFHQICPYSCDLYITLIPKSELNKNCSFQRIIRILGNIISYIIFLFVLLLIIAIISTNCNKWWGSIHFLRSFPCSSSKRGGSKSCDECAEKKKKSNRHNWPSITKFVCRKVCFYQLLELVQGRNLSTWYVLDITGSKYLHT